MGAATTRAPAPARARRRRPALRRAAPPLAAVPGPADLDAADGVQDGGGVHGARRRRVLPTEWSTEASTPIFSPSAQTPVLRWFLNSVIAAFCTGARRARHGGAGGLRAGADGVPRQERSCSRSIIATLFVPPIIFLMPELPDRGGAGLARHAAGRDLPGRGERVRRVLPAPVLPRAPARSSRRRRSSTAPTAGRSSSASCCRCPARARDAVRAVVPHELERLPLAAVRAVQPGEPDAPGRAWRRCRAPTPRTSRWSWRVRRSRASRC